VQPIVSHAKPAELIATLGASHMHASLILLNLTLALGAGLRVKLDPDVCIVTTSLDSIEPLGQNIATYWSVSFLCAAEAIIIATGAVNVNYLLTR
jgi:hypothetical protein